MEARLRYVMGAPTPRETYYTRLPVATVEAIAVEHGIEPIITLAKRFTNAAMGEPQYVGCYWRVEK